jgi:DNA-binding NarL/FixJ family response regulator
MKSQKKKRVANGLSSATPGPKRLLVCDDQLLVRARVREMLKKTTSIQIVGEATGGKEAVKMALELQPDIILMDVLMPDLDGIQATRRILSKSPQIKILAFSAETGSVTMGMMFTAGARGYLLKTCDADEFVLALQKVLAGEFFLSPQPSKPRPRTD